MEHVISESSEKNVIVLYDVEIQITSFLPDFELFGSWILKKDTGLFDFQILSNLLYLKLDISLESKIILT